METIGTLKLRKPLLVNGENVYEIPYDFEALTVEDITEADRYRFEEKGLPALYPTVDRATQLEIFARAVEKATQDIGREDLQRLGAKDGMRAANLARDFMGAEDDETCESASPLDENGGTNIYPLSVYQSGDLEDGGETISP